MQQFKKHDIVTTQKLYKMQIIQQTTRINAQEEVQGTIAMYSYEFEKGQNPYVITFTASRKGVDNPYGVPIQGTVTESSFNINNSNSQQSDIELYRHIYDVCLGLIKGESTEKPKANDKEK